MATAPKPTTLSREDYPEQAGWIDRLLRPLNAFMSEVSSTLSGRLTLGDNVMAQTEVVRVDTPATVANAFPVYFAVKMSAKPRALVVARVEDLTTSSSTFSSAVFATWEPTNDNRVKLSLVSGLSANTKYRFTLLLFP
jgi:hypothetical protein